MGFMCLCTQICALLWVCVPVCECMHTMWVQCLRRPEEDKSFPEPELQVVMCSHEGVVNQT